MKKMINIPTSDLSEFCILNGSKYAVSSLKDAYSFCKGIALGHYENFPIGSILVPKSKRNHLYAVYAFARIADDIGDEFTLISSNDNALKVLEKYENCLESIFSNAKKIDNPVFLALQNTIKFLNIPITPFKKLIAAFRSDINFQQPNDFDGLLKYCDNSANPVGEIMLYLFDEHKDRTIYYSNLVCTGLQLINFWQDLSIDINRNRCNIPISILGKAYNYNKVADLLVDKEINISKILEQLYNWTQEQYAEGKNITKYISFSNFRFILELKVIIWGGRLIFRKVKKQGTNIFTNRPKL